MNKTTTKFVGRYTTTIITRSPFASDVLDPKIKIDSYHLGWGGADADTPIRAVELSLLPYACDDPAKAGSYFIDATGYLKKATASRTSERAYARFANEFATVEIKVTIQDDRIYDIMCAALDSFAVTEHDITRPWFMRGYDKWSESLKRRVQAKIKEVGCAFVDGYVIPRADKPYDYQYMVSIIKDKRIVIDFWPFRSHQTYIGHVARALRNAKHGSSARLWSSIRLDAEKAGYIGDPRSDAARAYAALLVAVVWLQHYQGTRSLKLSHVYIDMHRADPYELLDCIYAPGCGVKDVTFPTFVSCVEIALNSPHVSDYFKAPIAQLLIKVCEDVAGKPMIDSLNAIQTWIATAITKFNRINSDHEE